MKRIIFLILITIITFNIFNYSTIDSFAAKKKNKKQEIEKVSALIISETEEVEFDEPEIDEIIDGLEMHGSPMSEEVSNIEPLVGPGMSKSNKEQKFDYIPTANNLNISNERQKLLEYALRFLGGKYKFGGNTIDGFDCSGFTQYIYKQSLGKNLLRNSSSQSTQGKTVTEENIQVGDLVFYGNGKRINHVAIYIGDDKVIHASNERTGIKISPLKYREPLLMKSVL